MLKPQYVMTMTLPGMGLYKTVKGSGDPSKKLSSNRVGCPVTGLERSRVFHFNGEMEALCAEWEAQLPAFGHYRGNGWFNIDGLEITETLLGNMERHGVRRTFNHDEPHEAAIVVGELRMTCDWCGKPYLPQKPMTANKHLTCCSVECGDRAKGERGETSCVYLIGCHAVKRFKVGVSNNPRRRLIDLQCQSPYPLTLAKAFRYPSTKEAMRAEGVAHSALESARSHGEWFNHRNGEFQAAASWLKGEGGEELNLG